VKYRDLLWLAGLVEGEGSIAAYREKDKTYWVPRIQLAMVDQDVVERAANLMNVSFHHVHPPSFVRAGAQAQWRLGLRGKRAVSLMMALYPHLGGRRREQIETSYAKWKTNRGVSRGVNHYKSTLNEEQVRGIRRLFGIETQQRIAYRFGVSRSTVNSIACGKSWSWLT
jgi:hypothetical protein